MIHMIVMSTDVLEEFDYYHGMFLGHVFCRFDGCFRHHWINNLDDHYRSERYRFPVYEFQIGDLHVGGWSEAAFDNYFLESAFLNDAYE